MGAGGGGRRSSESSSVRLESEALDIGESRCLSPSQRHGILKLGIAILILTEVTSKFHAKKRLLQYMNSVFSGSLIYRTVLDRCMPCRIHVVMPLYPDNQKGR